MALTLALAACFLCSVGAQSMVDDYTPPLKTPPNGLFLSDSNTTRNSTYHRTVEQLYDCLLVADAEVLGKGKVCHSGTGSNNATGFSQCYNQTTRDCGTCLSRVRQYFNTSNPLAMGARLYLKSSDFGCYLRYENYNFITDAFLQPANPANPGKPATKGKKGVLVGALLGSLVFLCICIGAGSLVFKQSRRKKQLGVFQGSITGLNVYSYNELKSATENFIETNKLGEGGFGSVYKGVVKNETVAIKKLALVESDKGKADFVNEVVIINNIRHVNLVKLKGYCVEGMRKLLVLEFLENGSLDSALFSNKQYLSWEERFNILIGVARGLAYLHEESSHGKIIHRDIKAGNILLDEKLNPKITDFGISKLFDAEKGFTSTNVAGTRGYVAPEYAMKGTLTEKADVFSYGVVALEIVSGERCINTLQGDHQLLLQRAWKLYEKGEWDKLVDTRLEGEYSEVEVFRALHLALVCTQENASRRPAMSKAVAMLLGYLELPLLPAEAPSYFGKTSSPSISTDSSLNVVHSTPNTEPEGR